MRRRSDNKNRYKEDAFAARYDSKMGRSIRTKKPGNPMIGAASDVTKNEKFVRFLGSGPTPDSRVGGGRAHTGTHGAPDIYREKPGGRKGKRGKRG